MVKTVNKSGLEKPFFWRDLKLQAVEWSPKLSLMIWFDDDMHNTDFLNIFSDWHNSWFFFISTEGWFDVCWFVCLQSDLQTQLRNYKRIILQSSQISNKTSELQTYHYTGVRFQTILLNYKHITILESDFNQNFCTTNTSLYRSQISKNTYYDYRSICSLSLLWLSIYLQLVLVMNIYLSAACPC